MDLRTLQEVTEWLKFIPETALVADLGSYKVNHSVRDIRSSIVGFDLQEGQGVDVVLQEGSIPEDHQEKYDAVVAIQSFQFSPHPSKWKQEVIQLLKPNGKLLMTTCADYCRLNHATSPKTEKLPLRRTTGRDLTNFLAPEIVIEKTKAIEHMGHILWVFLGRKK